MKNDVSRGCCFAKNDKNENTAIYKSGCQKMATYDFLEYIPNPLKRTDMYEIQFKNTRKGYFTNPSQLAIKKGDVVVVESNPGVNIGIVTMCTDMVFKQMAKKSFRPEGKEFQKIIRKPNPTDIARWEEAIAMEHDIMIRSRKITSQLGLDMKIGDVEYQADKLKAIFYYIADGRVDFRELIKVLAEQFRLRVEMKQIGARQEAGLIGALATCGRELCCSTWQNNFSTVGINAARVQDISPNPQKLAGQCGKLKCCLNYEVDVYVDARESLPRVNQPLETLDANYFLVKTDALTGTMYFSPDARNQANLTMLSIDKVKQIMAMNKRGQKPQNLGLYAQTPEVSSEEPAFENVVGQDSLTRFDKGATANPRRNNNRHRDNSNRDNSNRENSNRENSNRENGNRENNPRENNSRENNSGENRRRPQNNRPRPSRPRPENGETNSSENSGSNSNSRQENGEPRQNNRPNNNYKRPNRGVPKTEK